MIKKYIKMVLTVLLIPLLLGFCSKNYNTGQSLTDSEKDFISKVRYIIKKHEKKAFYSLVTKEEREDFIEDFWKKRDPNPSTEENEYKDEYYDLIDQANHLFKDEKKQGWLTDRGRVYILLGPPELRRFRPGEISSYGSRSSFYDKPHEIWYYGFYPILFVDRFENGALELTPLGAQHIATILRTANEWKPKVAKGEKIPLDFRLDVEKGKKGTVAVDVKLPYENILFQQDDKGNFFAVVTLRIDVFDPRDKKVRDSSRDYSIELTPKQLKKGNNYKIDTSIELDPGDYEIRVTLESKADDLRSSKSKRISI